MRNLVIIICLIVAGGATFASFKYDQKSDKASNALNDERYARMTAEENLESARAKIESLESELSRTSNKANGLEKKLEQVSAINKDLKIKLDSAQGKLVDLQAQVITIKGAVEEQTDAANTTVSVPLEGSGS